MNYGQKGNEVVLMMMSNGGLQVTRGIQEKEK